MLQKKSCKFENVSKETQKVTYLKKLDVLQNEKAFF